jgi:hypothetical protein
MQDVVDAIKTTCNVIAYHKKRLQVTNYTSRIVMYQILSNRQRVNI